MPLLDRLSDTPDDDSGQGTPPPQDLSPIIPGRSGRPGYSLEALRERIERALIEETANRPDILNDLTTEAEQRDLVREVADYVLGQDAIRLDHRAKADLIDRAYRNLFSFGPLDACLLDPAVIEITATAPHAVHARRRGEKPEPVQPAFDDAYHLESILDRLLAAGGTDLAHTGPFAEVGAVLKGRRARITLAGPPVSLGYSLTIRLHPAHPPSLDDLTAEPALIPPQAADVLRAILAAGRGLLIVGDAGTGKTTLAGALAAALPAQARAAIVERAAELPPPPGAAHFAGLDFGAALRAARAESPGWLLADEIRGDDSAAVWDILSRDDSPRLIAVFRGTHRPDRLLSALSILIRKERPALDQRELVATLVRHFPFVVALKAPDGAPQLSQIAALHVAPSGESLALEPLLWWHDGAWTLGPGAAGLSLDPPAAP
jgi:type IV secretory pathway ATPase VirB11/archaellum biosynthesis ATPase